MKFWITYINTFSEESCVQEDNDDDRGREENYQNQNH